MITQDSISERIQAVCREHALVISGIREKQVIQAIVEAFASGDFEMHIAVGDGGSASTVTYTPYAGVERQFSARALQD